MDTDDDGKYKIMENILHKINQGYVALSPEEKKRNNQLLQIVDRIIKSICSTNLLFANLYKEKFYGGSYYDNLKVGSPTEYDLDCLLCLPKSVKPTVVASSKSGYVHVVFNNMKALDEKTEEGKKYIGLNKLLDGNRLCTKKVKAWMEGLLASVLSKTKEAKIRIDDAGICVVKYRMVKSGPAYTIKLEGKHNGKEFNLDIDLVPCFKFTGDQWPKKGYRSIVKNGANSFFVVPKSPRDDLNQYWRLSFQQQEREIIKGCTFMKPSVKLIKKMRDRHQHKIASYHIKTVFLLELEHMDRSFWVKSLSFVFVTMLRKYCEYLERKNIPYYWNLNNNLISDLSDETVSCIANKIRRILNDIEKICDKKLDLCEIARFFLCKEEIESFKGDLTIGKALTNNEV